MPNLTFQNIQTFISDRMDLRYNLVRAATEYRLRGDDDYHTFSDRERAGLYIDMKETNDFDFSKTDYETYIISNRIPNYDPYLSYFESLPMWDGEDRIKQIAEYVQVEDTPQYNFAWQLKKWLIRAIKCALEPEYFNKQALIFVEASQNSGKTTFCRWLCPPALKGYWSEASPNGKDESIQLSSNIFIFDDELVKMGKSTEAEMKAKLSRTLIKYRPPYARTEQTFYRRCSFIATTNTKGFLTDETGSVRYLAFLVKSINFDYEKIDRNQLYAQAYHLYKGGFQCDMTKKEIEYQNEYNQQFRVQTTEQDMIQQYLRPARDTEPYGTIVYQWTTGQILQYLTDNINGIKLNAVQLGKSLRQLGFEQRGVSMNSIKRYVYPVVLNNSESFVNDILKKYTRKQREEL